MTNSHVNLVLQGHDHNRNETKLDGVEYITIDYLKDGCDNTAYMIVDASSRLEYQFVDVR